MSWDDEETVFVVVINDEEQYSIWPQHQALPAGWNAVGYAGKKTDCSRYIDERWKDMRPRSLREHLSGLERGAGAPR
jgi:MbtH protein